MSSKREFFCRKCEGQGAPKYRVNPAYGEHLEIGCLRCGYVWREKVSDHGNSRPSDSEYFESAKTMNPEGQ